MIFALFFSHFRHGDHMSVVLVSSAHKLHRNSSEEEVKVKVDIYRLVKGRWPIGKTPCSSGAVR